VTVASGLRHCDLNDKQSNVRWTAVESKSNRSCNHRIRPEQTGWSHILPSVERKGVTVCKFGHAANHTSPTSPLRQVCRSIACCFLPSPVSQQRWPLACQLVNTPNFGWNVSQKSRQAYREASFLFYTERISMFVQHFGAALSRERQVLARDE